MKYFSTRSSRFEEESVGWLLLLLSCFIAYCHYIFVVHINRSVEVRRNVHILGLLAEQVLRGLREKFQIFCEKIKTSRVFIGHKITMKKKY